MATVTLMVREGCGSCARVEGQIRPIVARHGAALEVVDVDAGDGADAVEFGDRVPVVLVDGEEIACWEIDDDELEDALQGIAD
ncbi:glutaredoxin family protein [Corynebacterium sp. 335C]